ncbi:MAG TPA: PEP-CTERM sorting domain-containing protein [Myxococcota bacterium]|nr:PEP-CTERM sorting domain-containing protein [Myxococcota bacterium]
MRGSRPTGFVATGLALLSLAGASHATTTQTEGVGSSVTSVDRSANFDSMTSNNAVALDNYQENGLSITTASTSWGEDPALAPMDPFHGADGSDRAFYAMANGSDTWVTIATTDTQKIFAVEFMYGNTWTTGDIFGQYPWGNHDAVLEWQTLDANDQVISSGTVGGGPLLEMGTIVGFSDPDGFASLQMQATMPNQTIQALALDGLKVQLQPVPEPSTLTLVGVGAGLLGVARRSRPR